MKCINITIYTHIYSYNSFARCKTQLNTAWKGKRVTIKSRHIATLLRSDFGRLRAKRKLQMLDAKD